MMLVVLSLFGVVVHAWAGRSGGGGLTALSALLPVSQIRSSSAASYATKLNMNTELVEADHILEATNVPTKEERNVVLRQIMSVALPALAVSCF
jgi:hypothetical protein